MPRKTAVILVAGLFGIAVIVVIILAVINGMGDKSQAYLEDAVKITVDKDTGQIIEDDPALVDEGFENPGIVVFGLDYLTERDVHSAFTDFVRDQLTTYIEERHQGGYETLTLRPQDFKKKSKYTYTTTLRLGQTDELLPIEILADDFNGKARVIVGDPQNKYGGVFDSGTKVFFAD